MTEIRSPPCAEEAVWCRHQKQQYPTMACCVLPSRCQALPGCLLCVPWLLCGLQVATTAETCGAYPKI